MKKFLEVVFCKYKDPNIALWGKMVCILILGIHCIVGLFFPIEYKQMILCVFLGNIFILALNCWITLKKDYRYLDILTFLLLFVPNLHLFRGGNIGYFSMFYLFVFSVATIFILGIRVSLLFQIVGFIYLTWQLRGSGLQHILNMYNQNLLLRFPYLYLCIIGIAYIIMYSIQSYWVEKEKSHLILEKRINDEKKKLANISLEVITSMYSALSAKIPGIDEHCKHVASYSKKLAQKLNLSEEMCINAYYAGLLHEVGAVGLPDEVINQDALSDEQYEIYKTYVKRGYKIICELQISDEVAKGVLYHRENYDGSGYLEGLFGKNIPVLSRILAICDYVDRHLNWHETPEDVIEKIKRKQGIQFDSDMVEKMCEILVEEKEAS